MNPANLTRAEAMARSRTLMVRSYAVHVDLTGGAPGGARLAEPEETFVSTSVVEFASDGTPTWIDLIADAVLAADLDGEPLDATLFRCSRLPLTPGAGDHRLSVTALCRYSHTGEGLHRLVDPLDGRVYLYTQFETADARRMYACFEQPDLKATFQLTVRAPADWVVLSCAANPRCDKERGIWEFPATPPLATYVTALVAGQYHVEPGTVRTCRGELPAALACRASLRDCLDVERLRTTTQRGFDVYEAAFGVDYPFDSYDQVFVPEFNAGAMENAGCVTIRDEYLWRSRVTAAELDARNNTLLHELAHMWFGDLVTMRWWDDLWLNESFAEWASHYCQEEIAARYGGTDPWAGFAAGRKAWAFRVDQLPTTHPVAADMVDLDAVEQNFDGITYAKGAAVLKQLVGLVGRADFLRGVHNYLVEHAHGNASFADLLSALQATSGRDLSAFAADWLTSAGMNTLTPRIEADARGIIATVTVTQTAPEDHPRLRRHQLGIGLYDVRDGRLVRRHSIETEVAGPETAIPELVGTPRPALLLLNDGDATFAKVRLDDVSLVTALNRAGDVDDPLGRTLIQAVLQDLWRDAEVDSRTYLAAVLDSAAAETDMTALRARLRTAQQAATAYCDPAVRPEAQALLAGGLRRLLDAAAPGGDAQVAFADAWCEAARAEEAAVLAEWLEGRAVPSGLAVDPDRRWRILRTLARLGRIHEAAIEAALAADPTQTGREKAAGVRAALPDAASKQAAWIAASEDATVPNETHAQICRSFWQYGQEDVLRPYAGRYFELADAIAGRRGLWADRGNATVETALRDLWPSPVADEALIDRTQAWLADHVAAPPSVVKVVREALDGTHRMLAAQQASRTRRPPAR